MYALVRSVTISNSAFGVEIARAVRYMPVRTSAWSSARYQLLTRFSARHPYAGTRCVHTCTLLLQRKVLHMRGLQIYGAM